MLHVQRLEQLLTSYSLYDTEEAWIEPFLELTTYLANLESKKLPSVISISYSVNEQHVPKPYAKQVCNMFGVLGARGVSVVVAAGNRGPGIGCLSNDGKNTTKFIPNFPPACPYVTVVGGTDSYTHEVADDASSGGFSEYWSRPWWQEGAVEKYIKRHGKQWKKYFNRNGRAYPDVAALAWGHKIMNHGEVETTGGTSAASPTFGSVIALLNNERLKKGKAPLGFLNPWIYTTGRNGLKEYVFFTHSSLGLGTDMLQHHRRQVRRLSGRESLGSPVASDSERGMGRGRGVGCRDGLGHAAVQQAQEHGRLRG